MQKIGITLEELHDQDWQTQAAKKYPNIPKNTEVEIVGEAHNLYGRYMKVCYNGIIYYVKPWLVKAIG